MLCPTFASSTCIIVVVIVVVISLFKRYPIWSWWTDWLHILHAASWCGPLPKLWKLLFLACYYRCIRQNRPNVQTLSPLKFMDRLTSNLRGASWCGSQPKLWKLWFLVSYYRRSRHSNRPDVQTLSPLKVMDRLASRFTWDILVWVSTKGMEIIIFGLLL